MLRQLRAVVFLAVLVPTALSAQNITGTVTNKTTGKPSAGDDVVLIKLANGMQEADRTRTDARGHFTLPVDDQGMHLVRVSHAKVPYFQPVPPGTTKADVAVYESSDKVAGVTGAADVMRLQATDSSLEVTELFAVDNASSPAKTQFGARAFEIFLPAQAEITSGAAMGPGGMPLQASPVPTGEPGHYAFVFPIRPGETRFQIVYKLPYTGKFVFSPHISVPMQNLAVMLPKTMKFEQAGGTAFQPVNDDVNAQVYLIKDATVTQPLGFTVSGTGTMPKDSAGAAGDTANTAAGAEGAGAPTTPAQADNRPGGGLGNPIDTPDPLHKYRWWILSLIVAMFAVGIATAMRPVSRAALDESTHTIEFRSLGQYQAWLKRMGHSIEVIDVSTTKRWGFMLGPLRDTKTYTVTYEMRVGDTTISIADPIPPSGNGTGLMQALKEELFTLETDRVEGRITEEQYTAVKAALETVLRHALKKTSAPPNTSNS